MLFIVNASPYLTGQKFGKHVYVQNRLNWYAAQQYCQTNYADLSPLSTSWEEKQLRKATLGKVSGEFWIGLYKTGTYWKWSGGGYETSIVWDESQPSTYYDLFVRVCWDGCTMRTGWFASSLLRELPFFCFSTTVMEEKMAWEEALSTVKRHTLRSQVWPLRPRTFWPWKRSSRAPSPIGCGSGCASWLIAGCGWTAALWYTRPGQ